MGTFNLTGRSGWIWKVAEFSNLNQSTLNTSCCCINKCRTNTTYAEWMWMKSCFSVARKRKERKVFWDWEEPSQSCFTSLLLPASSLRGSSVLQTSAPVGPTDRALTAFPSSHAVNKGALLSAIASYTFVLLAQPNIALKSWLLFLITKECVSFIKTWIKV